MNAESVTIRSLLGQRLNQTEQYRIVNYTTETSAHPKFKVYVVTDATPL